MKRLKENKISYKITNDPNVKELVLVDKIMTRSRKIYTNHSENEFRFLINTARSNVVFIIAYSLEGDPLSFRSMIYFDEKGWDLGGATTPKGKKALVDYFIMVELLNKASSLNVKHYNLGDIGKEKNIGVHNFKKGVGGKELIYSGEWEWSNVPFLRITINFIIFLLMLNIMRKFFPSINNIRF
jgi:lipid II:glycine glycyltransferase (peptidoglycan interpeptide bridge formation enzyme)